MAKIGSLGDIVFEVSTKKTQTFGELSRTGSSRWNDHEIIGLKPISEFLGSDLEEITFSIILKAEFGVNPIKQLEIMRKIRDTGKTAPFLLGGKPISINHWSIRQISETHKIVDNKGNVLHVEASITLKEYVVRKKKATVKPKAAVKATAVKKKSGLGTMTITVKSVHIRSAPNVKGKVLGYAFKGQKLNVQSLSNGWYSLGQGKYITASTAYSSLKKG